MKNSLSLTSSMLLLICFPIEIPELADHGVSLPPNMQGLTDDQVVELKLKDEWEERCIPSGGAEFKKDEIGRRNGHGNNLSHLSHIYNTIYFSCIRIKLLFLNFF